MHQRFDNIIDAANWLASGAHFYARNNKPTPLYYAHLRGEEEIDLMTNTRLIYDTDSDDYSY